MKKILLFAAFLSFVLTMQVSAQSLTFKRQGPATVTSPYIPDSTQFIQIKGTVKNNTSNAIRFKIVRIVNNLPPAWHTSMCFDLCYSPGYDTIPTSKFSGDSLYTLGPNQSDSTSFYIDFEAVNEGLGMAIVRLQLGSNPADYTQDTFKLQIGDGVGIHPISTNVEDYQLSQNYPNPFNPSTTISFSIPNNESVTLKVYSALGKEVATLLNNEKLGAGSYNFDFDVNNYGLTSGVYYYTFTSGVFVQTKKMLLVK